jgi:multidrug transporter EmrE-like cation transporter
MSTRGLVLLLLTCVCSVSGNLLLRSSVLAAGGFSLSSGHPLSQLLKFAYDPKFVCGFFLYGLATLLWFSVISMENLSTCYPMLVSITFVLVTFGSVFFFGEHVSAWKLMGMGVILAGIVAVARA